ncbi:cytochrome P450 4C1-like isoform X2 [Planococcus citri]|uniref:cytochrome P450 4C1-like isoform X2 n=1 Tax=Planococcus citri TaxID=170843 RepID=UPI0031FA307F
MSLVTVLLVICVGLFFYKLCSPNRRISIYGNKIPGPKAYPVIGNGLSFLTKKSFLLLMYDFAATYGKVFKLWIGKQLFIVLTDPTDIEVFLSSTNKHLDKSDSYRFLDSWLGDTNLLTGDGDIWQIHRKLITPSFHFKMLENSTGMITRNAEILVDQLEKLVDGSDFDIESFVEKCSLDIICEMAMGTKMETQLSKNTQYLDSIKTMTDTIVKRAVSPWLHPELIFRFTKIGEFYFKALHVTKCFVLKVISERRKALQEHGEISSMEEQEGRKQAQPFLDFLLTKSSFSEAEIENEVQTFMFAGHDTTKATISFCLYCLSRNEDVQSKLLEEIKTTFSDTEGNPSYQDYVNMKYLECVIKETMRLYATIPIVSRKVNEDVRLPSGFLLPTGSLVNMFIFFLHRDKNLYPNPEKFYPERFESRDNRPPFAFIPFSAGPRNCIGQKFAMIEMKIIISKLLLQYQFLPAIKSDPPMIETCLVIRSMNKLPVRITQRNS